MPSAPISTAVPACVEAGGGDTAVLLLHGVSGGSAVWPPQMQALAEAGYRAVAWDMPGYGNSAPVAPYTMAALADALLALIHHLQAARTVLVGHSMGGMVVQEALARAPRCAQAVVLVGTSPAFGKPDGDWQQRFISERLAPLAAGKSMADLAEQLVPAMTTAAADPAGIARAKAVNAAVPAATYEAALRALAGFDRRAALADLDVPTLCLVGEFDTVAPPSVMRGMVERIRGARFEQIPDVGHLAPMEAPAAFNASLLGFLRETLA
ncbi:MAG: alpha/beta fold hydrolase [Burkholderiaceae bacterium]